MGGSNCISSGGCGTVFQLTEEGVLTTLYSFCKLSSCSDGSTPLSGLVQSGGALYGTTSAGGAQNAGTVFRLTPGGALVTLYSFCSQSSCADGSTPTAGLVHDLNGNFYGTTSAGGAHGAGAFFEITPGFTLTTLYSFCAVNGCTDGSTPVAGVIQSAIGNFYGTTLTGGAHSGGTVFKITPGGTLTTMHNFCSLPECSDGSFPRAGVILGTDGNLYGTTVSGGANTFLACLNGCGTIFQLTPQRALTTLYNFCTQSGCRDGYNTNQLGGLIQDTTGGFFGTAPSGGVYNDGTIFSLSIGLGPFVETRPDFGLPGSLVQILGTDLTGATSVTFDGTAAAFTLVSIREITATVPSGATTGYVEVVTPSGTLSSNVKFHPQ
jgi:uncharacterized repeat protein (TIGR03803 family)